MRAKVAAWVLMLGLSGILAISLNRVWSAPPVQWDLPQSQASIRSDVPPDTPLPLPPTRQDLTETLARPLFSSSRRPVPPPIQTPTRAVPPPTLVLVGTLAGPDGVVALVKVNGTPTAQRLTIGHSISGWDVIEIAKGRLLLRNGQTDHEIRNATPASTAGHSSLRIGSGSPATQ